MPIDFTLTMEQKRLQADARAFARDVLNKVGPATRGLPTPLARFAATRPFYDQTPAAGVLRRLRVGLNTRLPVQIIVVWRELKNDVCRLYETDFTDTA